MGGGTHVLKVFWSKLELGSKLLRHNFQKRIVEANGRLERGTGSKRSIECIVESFRPVSF